VNRIDRLLAIILHLQLRRSSTVEELANQFNLTKRTIYRDLVAIGEAGVPLLFEPKRGYSLPKGYSLPPVNLTEAEALALSMGCLLVDQLVDSSIRENLSTAAGKIKSVLPIDTKEGVEKLERAMAITAVPTEVEQTPLTTLQRAIRQNSEISFTYHKPGVEPEKRIANPLGLIHYLARWHLIAWCHKQKAHRDFRADRISQLVITDRKFVPQDNFSAAEFISSTMTSTKQTATVKFTTDSVDRARREWWLGIVSEEGAQDGHILRLATVEWLLLARWLFTFSDSATVIAPVELKEVLKSEAHKLLDHYSDD
jgi:predicted DNA-binding transcriptional regulator YafY